jgi:glycosyltransferase involved in cell wall biosynthesis
VKIALVTLRFDAPGGVETNVREVARRLHAMGEEVEVFASDLYDEARWDRRPDLSTSVDGVPVHRFPVYKRLVPGLTMPLMTGLLDALRAFDPDVIHAHSHRYGHVLEASLVAHRGEIPLVISTHYHPADRREPSLKRGLLRLQDVGFGMTAYRRAARLFVETRLEAEMVREFAPAGRIEIVPPGVDLAEWSRPEADHVTVALPEQFLLYAGRIAPNKGLDVLLRAIAALPTDARASLVLMGPDWGERQRLERLAGELGVGAQVQFLGHVADRGTYRAIFRRATVFVLPSEWEAFGLVLLEAMAAGVPIVATSVGGVPEVLAKGACGRLVPYGSAPALAEALGSLLRDAPARAGYVRAAHDRVRELTWDRCADRHRTIYRSLAG